MAGTKISALSSLSTLADGTIVPVVDSGTNYKLAATAIKTYVLSGTVTATNFAATSNGAGTSFKVGDDAWIGDVNLSNGFAVRGVQDASRGYIIFGNANNTAYIGRSGTDPITVTGDFATTGNITLSSNNKSLLFTTSTGANVSLIQQSDDNLVLYSTNASGAQRAVWSVFGQSSTSTFNLSIPLNAKQIQEVFGSPTLSNAATQTFDCSSAQAFNINMGTQAQNFVANLTNLNLPTGSVTTISFVLNQGSTPYIISGVQFEGNATGANGYTFTYTWQGSSTPAGVANKKDVIALNILCTAAKTYTVLAQLVSF